MSANSLERPELRCESVNDLFAMVNVLIRNGIDYDNKPWPPQLPEFKKEQTVGQLLTGMETVVRLATNRTVGFVLDADTPLHVRWAEVCERLKRVDVAVPATPPAGGFIGESRKYKSHVGVWLMPDNQSDGAIEAFLQTLIDQNDPLIDHSTSAADQAIKLGAVFPEQYRLKAVIHTWLAWQEDPGMPYGRAIEARYFAANSTVVDSFVAWFRRLYGI